jgi:hypothetical protein
MKPKKTKKNEEKRKVFKRSKPRNEKNKMTIGRVYSIRSFVQPTWVYFGSTTQSLSKRMGGHRMKYKKWIRGDKDYTTSFRIIALGDAYIDLVEVVEFETRDQLNAVEAKHIRVNDCVNKVQPGRTPLEYREEHREEAIERATKWYENNKEYADNRNKAYSVVHRAETAARHGVKIECACGTTHTHGHAARHLRTAKHQAFELKE